MGPSSTVARVASEDPPIFPLPPSKGALVDLAVLRELELQVNDRSVVLGFVRDFMELWDSRCNRLADALGKLDQDAALDVLLGLKTSAAMAGAVRLSHAAEDLEEALKRGDHRVANILWPNLEACGRQTLQELQDHYIKALERG